jgi:alkylation response protein AidB-like acyl-CoA dehydrogenase
MVQTTATLQAIQELLPAIRARREEIEQQRQLPRDLVDDLKRAGVFTLGVPRAFGGAEASPRETMEVIETAASADGSTGWCVMIGLSSATASGYMSESGGREVFTDITAPLAGLAAPSGQALPAPGGVRVSGRWPFGSGITHCDWVWAGCLVMEDGHPRMTPHGPEIVHVCLPVAETTVHDTWRVSGLCGTGSNDFSAADVFVPDRRIFRLLDPAGHRPEPLYQTPPMSIFVLQLASVSLGIARGALDEFAGLAQSKVPSLYTQVAADKAIPQVELARAEAALRAARALLYQAADELWESVNAGRVPAGRELAIPRIAATHAVETAAAVTRTANTLAGGSSIYSRAALQRHARDAEAITHHFTVAPYTWEEAGRVLLGRAPAVAVF